MRHAIIRDGIVEQIVLWDKSKPSAAKWAPPAGTICIPCPDDLHLGATYDGKEFKQPEPVESASAGNVGADGLTDDERVTLKGLLAKAIK
jgi:hypothetical protein